MNLHLVIGQEDCLHFSMEYIVEQALQAGVTHVQLREKKANMRECLAIGRALQRGLKNQKIPLIINDRVDLALALDAEGVHLGQTDMPYLEARRLLGADKWIGLTVENINQVREANTWGLDYVGVGPVFSTCSKQNAPEPIGVDGLKQICQESIHPVIAIGGIQAMHVPALMRVGIQGIAVISAIAHSRDPFKSTQELIWPMSVY